MKIPDIPQQILDRLSQLGAATDWPAHEELVASMPGVMPFTTSMLPPALAPWLQDTSERMQCPLDFLGVGAITAVSSIIGTGCLVRPKAFDNWTVVPNTWGAIVGEPGAMKSPALEETIRPIVLLEKDAREDYERDLMTYRTAVVVYKATQDRLKQQMQQIAKTQARAAPVPPGVALPATGPGTPLGVLSAQLASLPVPEEPLQRRFKTHDATPEKLLELLRDNPRGILLYRDELSGHLARMDQEEHASERAFYLEGWNGGGSFTQDRIGRGTVHADSVCLAMLGGVQPSKLQSYFAGAIEGYENDGFIQRIQLLVYPDPVKHWTLVDRVPDQAAQERAVKLIHGLGYADFVGFGAVQDQTSKAPYFRFSEPAQVLFNTWLTNLEAQLRGDDPDVLKQHFSKYRSLLPSLALIFHVLDVASSAHTDMAVGGLTVTTYTLRGPISVQATQLALVWCDYLASHARRVYGMSTDPTYGVACLLASKLKAGGLSDGFNVRDVVRKSWSGLTKREAVAAAVAELVAAGWLRPVPATYAGIGRRPIATYQINPSVRGAS